VLFFTGRKSAPARFSPCPAALGGRPRAVVYGTMTKITEKIPLIVIPSAVQRFGSTSLLMQSQPPAVLHSLSFVETNRCWKMVHTAAKLLPSAQRFTHAEEPKSGGWWQTVPGVLTAVAGFMSAMAALIIALHQVGFVGGEEPASAFESKPSPNPARESEQFVGPLPGTTSKGSILDEMINTKQSVKATKPLTKGEVF
jgi:hypothetical protein